MDPMSLEDPLKTNQSGDLFEAGKGHQEFQVT